MSAAILKLNAESAQALADRLFSLGTSNITTIGPKEQADLVAASRALRRLLAAYERAAGHELHTILLAGGC
jgi:hypothetical protein